MRQFFYKGSKRMSRSDATFVPWLDSLRQHLIKTYPFENDLGPVPDDSFLEPRWKLRLENSDFQVPKQHTNGYANGDLRAINGVSNDHNHAVEPSQPDPISNGLQIPSLPLIATGYPDNIDLPVSLIQNQRITPTTHFQDVRHLIFTTPQIFTYMPGDILTIYPQNPEKDVQLMLNMMEWAPIADAPLSFRHTHAASQSTFDQPPIPPSSMPSPPTLRHLLTSTLDINAIPRRLFFSTISHFTTDETQRSRLLEFASPELSEELHDYATRPRRSILETLHDFHTVRIPVEYAAAVLPLLRGRQFSIASGGELLRKGPPTLHHSRYLEPPSVTEPTEDSPSIPHMGTRIDVLMALVSYRTVLKRVRQGTCSRYITALPTGSQLRVTFQRGSFGLKPSDIKRPVLLVGPGTGLAPMRALIWQRKAWAESYLKHREAQASMDRLSNGTSTPSEGVGETILFFGSRSRQADYFFENEWASLVRNPSFPFQVFTAFSRDSSEGQTDLKAFPHDHDSASTPSISAWPSKEPAQVTNSPEAPDSSSQVIVKSKPYVQSLIRAQAKLVYDILHNKGGKIFVSGSAGAMPRGIREAVVDVFEKEGAQDREDAERGVREIEQAGRWIVECW